MDSNLIRFIRLSRGLSQQELADLLGVSKTLVCLIEKNKKNMSDNVRRKFRVAFGNEYIEKCRAFLEQN